MHQGEVNRKIKKEDVGGILKHLEKYQNMHAIIMVNHLNKNMNINLGVKENLQV